MNVIMRVWAWLCIVLQSCRFSKFTVQGIIVNHQMVSSSYENATCFCRSRGDYILLCVFYISYFCSELFVIQTSVKFRDVAELYLDFVSFQHIAFRLGNFNCLNLRRSFKRCGQILLTRVLPMALAPSQNLKKKWKGLFMIIFLL